MKNLVENIEKKVSKLIQLYQSVEKKREEIFVNLLKLIAVPLVFASLIKGVASLSDISKLSRIGGKTISFYLASTVIAVTIGLFLVNSVQPGKTFSEEKRMELKEQ